MEKEFALYPEAFELKELGFDKPCFGWYDREYKDIINYDRTRNSGVWLNDSSCSAPTYSQAFRFFREKYGLNSCIDGLIGRYYYNIRSWKNEAHESYYNTYEEAELACLRKLIEIVKNK